MRKLIFTMLAIFSLIILVSLDNETYGQLVTEKELSHYSDQTIPADTLIDSTATYDPCCNVLDWYEEFYRTWQESPTYYLRFHYNGTDVHHQYYSPYYENNQTHSFYGQRNVGPSTAHKLVISKNSASSYGCFQSMYMRARYFSSGGSAPGRE